MSYEILRRIADRVEDGWEVAFGESSPIKEEHGGAWNRVGNDLSSVASQHLEGSS